MPGHHVHWKCSQQFTRSDSNCIGRVRTTTGDISLYECVRSEETSRGVRWVQRLQTWYWREKVS